MKEERFKEIFRLLTNCVKGIEDLRVDVKGLGIRTGRLESGFQELKAGQIRLEEGHKRLEQGHENLVGGQVQLASRMKSLESRQERVEDRLTNLESGQTRLEKEMKINNKMLAAVINGQSRLSARVDILEEKAV